MTITLRPYQQDVIARTRDAMRHYRRVLLQMPTGAGKTAVAAFMTGESARRGHRTWFVCHRQELVAQTSGTFDAVGIPHSLVTPTAPLEASAAVQVCSVQTLKNRLDRLPAPELIVWDECHHLGAAGWAAIQAAYPSAWHVGLSATPCRLDGKGLREHFDFMVQGVTCAWLIENGYLSPYRAYAPSAPDMKGVRRSHGDYARGETEELMTSSHLTGDAIEHWKRLAGGRRSVGFAVTVRHSQSLAAAFCAQGIPAAHLDGGTPRDERREIIRRFADGELQVLFNVDLFGEGFDLSAIAGRPVTIDCALLLRPTQSLALHLQQIGRALRPAEGKTAIILDHAGNIQRHGLPDDPQEWSLDGAKKRAKAANDNDPQAPVTCEQCFGQIKRPAPERCPYCGAELPRQVREIEVQAGELKEVTEADRARMRRQRAWEQAQCETIQDLINLARKRGYKSPQGWAWHVFSQRRRAA